ncbi:MAG: N-6 DNA methylase [Enterococcus sp.]|nr:N-6 DNA methylase [Enterococcus sp.]
MLGAYNEETKKTANEASGSFYTPRQIVNYMTDISLQAYLGNTDEVKALFDDNFENNPEQKPFYDTIIEKLKTIKVLDPACGSGAFPMGMLNRIVEILQRLNAPGSKYDLKLQIMENCIYGGDIQTIAAQITKLRFFISLVCDCEKTDNADDNYGIPNLPNLETHFVSADSLGTLEKPQQGNLFEQDVIALKTKLQEVRHEHFMAKTTYQKIKLRNRDKELREELAEMLKSDDVIASEDALKLIAWNPYDQNSKADFFDPEWMFGIKDGFDIVIGNPPYVQVKKGLYSKTEFPYSEGKDTGKQNLYKMFVELGYNLCKQDTGVSCMIVQSSLMCDQSSTHTRELLLKNTQLQCVIEFPKTAPTKEGQVFKSVCQGTCIYLFSKKAPTDEQFLLSVNNDCTTIDAMNVERVTQSSLIDFYPEDFAIPLIKNGEFLILKQIKQNSSPLSRFIVDVSQGDLNLNNAKNEIKLFYTGVKLLRGKNIAAYHINYDVEEFIDKNQ